MGNFPWHSTSEGAKQSSTRASGKRSRSAALQSVRVRAGIIVGVFVLLAFFVFNVAYADRVQPGVSSLGVDLGSKPQTDVKSLLNSEFKTISQQEVILRYEADIWRLTPGALGLTLDADATVKKAMAAGQSSNPIQGVTSKLGIGVKPQVVEPVLIVDRTRASAALADIIAKIDRPVVNASLVPKAGGKIEVTPSIIGRKVDVDATLTRAQGSFSNGKPAEIELVVETTQPKVVEAQLEQARTTALKIVGRPLVIFRGEIIHTLYQEELTSMLTFRQEGDRSVADLDPNELAIVVQEMAGKVNREPKDATFRFAGGVLSVATESEDGLKVDVSASVEAIRKAAITENRNVELVVKITPPAVASKDMDKMGIKERLITAGTVYGDTGLDRQYNVRLAVERLDGTLIPPGSTYSFNEALGPTGIEDGYRYGWGIISTATGGHETVKSEAGGICQVATTMFHAAFNLGLRIDERTEHIYWIPRYGRPPLGKTGLDATVDGSGSATTLDLKFTNTTKHWLAIEGSYDGMNMYFSIWGTDPGWTVEVGEPEISNIVYTSTQVVRIIDKGLEVGEEVWTESAQDGFDVTVRRIVSSGGKVLDDMTVVSHYRPAQNVIRYNPATTPTPQATVPGAGTPSATEPGATAPAEGTPPAEPVPTATPGGEPDPRATEPKPAG